AFEAAESGLDFAISALASGRSDAACQPSDDVTVTTFRDRMLTADPATGNISLSAAQASLRPTCMMLDAGMTCSCPGPAAAAPVLAPPVGGQAPTFQLSFQAGIAQPGVVRVTSKGCNSIGSQCYRDDFPSTADAVAEVSVLLGLNSALATPPSA